MSFLPRPERVESRHDLGGGRAILFLATGGALFEHRCDRSPANPRRHARFRADAGVITIAPALTAHRIAQREPLTITPSLLCEDCGTHGFVTAGKWVPT